MRVLRSDSCFVVKMSDSLCFWAFDFFIFSDGNAIDYLRDFFKRPVSECRVSAKLCALAGVLVGVHVG